MCIYSDGLSCFSIFNSRQQHKRISLAFYLTNKIQKHQVGLFVCQPRSCSGQMLKGNHGSPFILIFQKLISPALCGQCQTAEDKIGFLGFRQQLSFLKAIKRPTSKRHCSHWTEELFKFLLHLFELRIFHQTNWQIRLFLNQNARSQGARRQESYF